MPRLHRPGKPVCTLPHSISVPSPCPVLIWLSLTLGHRRPYRPYREDLYESLLIDDDNDSRRPWETAALVCDHTHCIRGCIIADWSATSDVPPAPGTILQSELVAGTVLLHRLLYIDYWPLVKSFSDSRVEIRLITLPLTSVRAVNVGLSLSASKTTVSFALRDFAPFYIDDAEKTTSWQPLLSWTLGGHGESQRQNEEGGMSPTDDMGGQFAIRGRPKVRTSGGGFENKSQEVVIGAGGGAGRNRSVSDSVDWAEENTGSRVPSKTELELSQLRGEE
ncbi:hypothetical protein OQA88_1048 [Cercophora sp. LCS_1]